MSEIIRAVQTQVIFGKTAIDAYKLENYTFERRFGVTGISEVLGYSKEWFSRLPKQGIKQFNSLQKEGFTGCQTDVSVPRRDGKRGASLAKTLSIRDFNKIIAYEAIKKQNIKAIILLVALSERGLENLINDAFDGVSLDWFAEKIIHYTKWTIEEFEEVLQYNRDEVKDLYAWANDPVDREWDIPLRLRLKWEPDSRKNIVEAIALLVRIWLDLAVGLSLPTENQHFR